MPEKVSFSAHSNVEILWDVEIDGKVKQNRPDIKIMEIDVRKWYFVDVTVHQNHSVVIKKPVKVDKVGTG